MWLMPLDCVAERSNICIDYLRGGVVDRLRDEANLITVTKADGHPVTSCWTGALMPKQKGICIRYAFANVRRHGEHPALLEQRRQQTRHQLSRCDCLCSVGVPGIAFQLEFDRAVILALSLNTAGPRGCDDIAYSIHRCHGETKHTQSYRCQMMSGVVQLTRSLLVAFVYRHRRKICLKRHLLLHRAVRGRPARVRQTLVLLVLVLATKHGENCVRWRGGSNSCEQDFGIELMSESLCSLIAKIRCKCARRSKVGEAVLTHAITGTNGSLADPALQSSPGKQVAIITKWCQQAQQLLV